MLDGQKKLWITKYHDGKQTIKTLVAIFASSVKHHVLKKVSHPEYKSHEVIKNITRVFTACLAHS